MQRDAAARGVVYNRVMNKRVIMLFAIIFGGLGGYASALFGDTDFLDGWSLLGGFVGGIFGVWLGVVVSKRWG